MELITEEIWKKLPGLRATAEMTNDQIPVRAKLFTPFANAAWFITEGDRNSGTLFGLRYLGPGVPELGYFPLQEIEELHGKLGVHVERALHWTGTLADAWQQVRCMAAGAPMNTETPSITPSPGDPNAIDLTCGCHAIRKDEESPWRIRDEDCDVLFLVPAFTDRAAVRLIWDAYQRGLHEGANNGREQLQYELCRLIGAAER